MAKTPAPRGTLRGPQGPQGVPGQTGQTGSPGSTGPAGASFADASIFAAGNLTGTVTLNAANGPRQAGTMTGNVTCNAPSGGAAGRVLILHLAASGASRVWTFAAAIGRMAGYPNSFQLPVGKHARVALEWSSAQARWVLLGFQVEQ